MSTEAEEVTVIVYGARHLPTKKKGKRKYSVIFGVGQNKFRTDVVQDFFGNPDWNNESAITVENSDKPLLLVVTEKEEILGQVSLNLSDLSNFKSGRQTKARLQEHKKCSDPEGELLYEAWVSKTRPSADTQSLTSSSSKGTLKKLKGRLAHSPLMKRKFGSSGRVTLDTSEALPGMGPTASQSSFELGPDSAYSNLKGSSSQSMFQINTIGNGSGGMHRRYGSFKDLTEEDERPEITGISPRESPVEGGTRVTIRGVNLGTDEADVVGLSICGANCLASLEYESSRKLYATTKAWKPGTGNIVVETQSGGKGVSLVEFTFTESKDTLAVGQPSIQSSPRLGKRVTPPSSRTLPPTSSNQSLTPTPEESGLEAQKMPPPSIFVTSETTPPPAQEVTNQRPQGPPPAQEVTNQRPKGPPPPLFSSTSQLEEATETPDPAPHSVVTDSSRADSDPKSPEPLDRGDSMKDKDAPSAQTHSSTFYDITFIEDAKEDDEFLPPEVSGIRPREGPIDGGTHLTIRGQNLGVDKEDVTGLYVCGADCLSTLKYMSPTKLHCTTKSWRACTGPIVVETQSGGKGTSLVEFTFKPLPPPAPYDAGDAGMTHAKGSSPLPPASPQIAKEPVYATYPRQSSPAEVGPVANTLPKAGRSRSQSPDVDDSNHGDESPNAKNKRKSKGNILARLSGSNQDKKNGSAKRELNTDAGTVAPVIDEHILKKLQEFERLQAENNVLREQNANMKGYIEGLVSKVIVLCPDALCVDESVE